jgi:hypothetical protein
MSVTEGPVQDIESFLDQKIEEAGLDLSDVQVKAVITAVCEVIAWHANTTMELLKRCRRVQLDKLSMSRLLEWAEEQDRKGDPAEHVKRLLLKADVDLEDEAVIEALGVARDVLIHSYKYTDSVFEKFNKATARE